MRKPSREEILNFVSEIGVGICIGVAIDFFAGTGILFTAIGLVCGVGLAVYLQKTRQKRKGNQATPPQQ